jgi:urea transport system permease protein
MPEYWLYVLGLLFILVTLFMPQGVVGLARGWREKWSARAGRAKAREAGSYRPEPTS